MSEKKLDKQTSSDFKFLYWDDLGDSQSEVDNQGAIPDWKKEILEKETWMLCSDHQKDLDDSEREEEEAERRMQIIMRNGNSGEHYELYDDGELEDIE